MPNASRKKNLKPKIHRVTNALEYARGFVASIGDKSTTLTKAQNMEKASRACVPPDINTANFWANIVGHINKV